MSGESDGDQLTLTVSNPVVPDGPRKTGGNKMAMSNIQQRYELAYGGRASVDVEDEDERFTVRLRFPIEGVA